MQQNRSKIQLMPDAIYTVHTFAMQTVCKMAA
jgi:hypothetical protein